MSKYDIVADIGSKFLNMALTHRDFILREPSVVATDNLNKNQFIHSGLKALKVAEEDTLNTNLIYPIEGGVVRDAAAFKFLISNALLKILPSKVFLSDIKVWCVIKSTLDDTVKRTIDDTFNELGLKQVEFIPSGVADFYAAQKQLGCTSCITVNLGSGLTEVYAVNEGKILAGASMKWAGKNLEQQIADYVNSKYNMTISHSETIGIRKNCISLYPNNMSVYKFKGINVEKNEEQVADISARELYETAAKFFDNITTVVNSIFLSVSAADAESLRENGVILCGGLSDIEGMEKYFYDALKVTVRMLTEPETSSIEGAKQVALSKK